MAKQQKTPVQKQAPRKPAASEFSPVMYVLRNIAVIIGIAFLFFIVDNRNAAQSQMQDMMQEFYQLRQTGSNPARMQELYDEIIKIQNDTSFLTRTTRGYHWAIHDLAIGNYQNIQSIDSAFRVNKVDSTKESLLEAKMRMKFANYNLLKYINDNTPKDAVILLPPADTAITTKSKWSFIYEPEWVEYFIYPRLCIAPVPGIKDYPELAKKITHVLIVEGKGYENLKYDVPIEQRPTEGIFPINQPPANLNPQ